MSGTPENEDMPGIGYFARLKAASVFVVALSFGAVSAFYWAFTVDLISGMSESPFDIGPVFYVVAGVVGFTGLLTGDAVARVGLVPMLLAILAGLVAACALLGVAPGAIVAAGVSAALYGVGVMTMSSLLALWSLLVFPSNLRPASAPLCFFSGSAAWPVLPR